MFWRLTFVVALTVSLMVACSDRYRNQCDNPANIGRPPCAAPITYCPTTKNKALGYVPTTRLAAETPATPC